jgi:HEAT repeat protein
VAVDPPENLLKSALEKVVFFECRIEQLERDLESTSSERERLQRQLAEAAARELALQQELASAQSRLLARTRESEEWQARAASLRAEREQWLTKMIEGERIRQAGESIEGGVDLASFIAELRAEVAALREGRPVERLPVAAREAPPRNVTEAAVKMEKAGRIGFTEADRQSMVQTARFETRAEETVFAFSLRELSSPHPESRVRAAERLKTLGTREAAAALAAALNTEFEAQVRPALIEALAATSGAEALPLLTPHLRSPEVTVRLAALEATVKLSGDSAKLDLDRALGDESPRVRRRAALLAGSLGATTGAPLLAHATADADASVRRVAVLSLASFGGEPARRALLGAAEDSDLGVRRAACQGLARLFGEPLLALAEETSLRRRRELRRLETAPLAPLPTVKAKTPSKHVLEIVPSVSSKPSSEHEHEHEREPRAAIEAESEFESARGSVESPRAHEKSSAVIEASEPVAAKTVESSATSEKNAGDPELAEQVLTEVATSIRGRTLEELAALAPEDVVARTAAALMGQGRLVRRNQRFYLA